MYTSKLSAASVSQRSRRVLNETTPRLFRPLFLFIPASSIHILHHRHFKRALFQGPTPGPIAAKPWVYETTTPLSQKKRLPRNPLPPPTTFVLFYQAAQLNHFAPPSPWWRIDEQDGIKHCLVSGARPLVWSCRESVRVRGISPGPRPDALCRELRRPFEFLVLVSRNKTKRCFIDCV